MDNNAFNLTYTTFNIAEGVFWIIMGIVLLYIAKIPASKKKWFSIYSLAVFTLFGISDFIESQVGSFLLPGTLWLFIWKILCVIGLIGIVLWYLRIKLITKHE